MVVSRTQNSLIGCIIQEQYQIIQALGTSAYRQTYLAEDISRPGHPKCVVKHYQPNRDHPKLIKAGKHLFFNELESLKRLGRYCQIPKLLGCFEENQEFHLVQEWIAGRSLNSYLPLKLEGYLLEMQVLQWLQGMLEVLEFVHRCGWIHCALKPTKFIQRASDQKWVLVDFGSAQPIIWHLDSSPLMRVLPSGATAVSPLGYLAPEQLVGKSYPSSDLYALGAMGIQMLTGLDPAKLQLDLQTGEISWQHLFSESVTMPMFGDALTVILSRMVSYNHEDRYQCARDVIDALQPLQGLITESHQRTLEQEKANSEFQDSFPVEGEFSSEWAEAGGIVYFPFPVVEESENERAQSVHYSVSSGKVTPWYVSKLPLLLSVGLGITVLHTLAIAFGLNSLFEPSTADAEGKLLSKAEQEYQEGNIEDAIEIINAISPDSAAYEASVAIAQAWQQEWQDAATHFQSIQNAHSQQQWQTVVATAQKMPKVDYWQQKIETQVQQAQQQLESQAYVLLKKAYQHATQRQFTQALDYLHQIPPYTSVGSKVQQKIAEYSKKEEVRANYYLQQAYRSAEQREFQQAIQFLQQIPEKTSVSEIAKTKLAEYQDKQRIKEQVMQRQQVSQVPLSQLNPGLQLQEIRPQ